MEKPNAVLEISNSSIKVVVGYVVNDKPAIIFTHEVATDGVIRDGEVVDFDGLVSLLEQIKVISDNEAHVRITLKEVTLLFPAIGFSVFTSEKSTGVVSQSSLVQEIDIRNVIALVQKDPLPNGFQTIDIIPVSFALVGDRKYSVPPIGEKSSSLTVNAFIHAIPKHVYEGYVRALEKVDIAVKRSFVSVYAECELARAKKNLPSSYILVDMGEGVTSLTLVGKNYPYNSTHFAYGSGNLAKLVSDNLNISKEKALEYIFKYGVDDRNKSFNPPIGEGIPDEEGKTTSFTAKDLTALIKLYLETYKQKLSAGLAALTEGHSEEVKNLPLVISGGFSTMHGMKEFLKENIPSEVYFLCPSSVGVTSPRYNASIGAMLLSSHYRGSLTDQQAKVAEIKREE